MKRFLLAWVVIVSSSFARADNWPQWRGPHHDGVSKETKLPVEWSDTKNVAWKLQMPGIGGSTPCVWEQRLFLTSQDGKDVVLLCISTDGKELWKRKLGTAGPLHRNEGNGASPSPSTDGKHVYAFAGSGEVACFDFDGKPVWQFNAQERYERFGIAYGMHSTPLLHADRLYMQLIHDNGAWVIALDKATGKDVWKVKRISDGTGENKHSYASPCLWTNGKDAYLITHGNDYAIAFSLDDGKEIWRVAGLNPKGVGYRRDLRFVASPVATPDLIVVPSAKFKGVVGIKPDAKGLIEAGNESELWRKPSNTPDVPSPLVNDGLVYLCLDGTLICLDAKTGKQHYSERIYSDKYRGSPVFAGGKVYLTSFRGVITVVKAGPKFEKLAENKMSDQVTASPALANGRIYIRGWETLYAIEAK